MTQAKETKATENAGPTDLIGTKAGRLRQRHETIGTGGIPEPEDLSTETVGGHERITGAEARWLMVALAEVATVGADAYGAKRILLVGPEGEPYLAGDGDAEGLDLPWLELTHSWESALGQMVNFVRFAEQEGWEVEGKEECERMCSAHVDGVRTV